MWFTYQMFKKGNIHKKTKDNESSGYICFDFLNNARGYCLCTSVDSPELIDFFLKK